MTSEAAKTAEHEGAAPFAERFLAYGNSTVAPFVAEHALAERFPKLAGETRAGALRAVEAFVSDHASLLTRRPPLRKAAVNVANNMIASRIVADFVRPPAAADFTFRVRDGPIAEGIAQRTDPWFAARDKLITASQFGTILGMNPYETRERFVLKKIQGETFSEFAYENMNRGTCFEDVIIEFLGTTGVSRPQDADLIVSAEFPFLGASPDGYIADLGPLFPDAPFRDALIECKAPKPGTRLSGVPKPQYWAQMQLQMLCAEKAQCVFVESAIGYFAGRDAFLADDRVAYRERPYDLSMFGIAPPAVAAEPVPAEIPPQSRFSDRFLMTADGMVKGVFVVAGIRTRDLVYEHVPGSLDAGDQIRRAHEILAAFRERGLGDAEIRYWFMEDAAYAMVYRDDAWLAGAVAEAGEFFRETLAPALQAARDAAELAEELARGADELPEDSD